MIKLGTFSVSYHRPGFQFLGRTLKSRAVLGALVVVGSGLVLASRRDSAQSDQDVAIWGVEGAVSGRATSQPSGCGAIHSTDPSIIRRDAGFTDVSAAAGLDARHTAPETKFHDRYISYNYLITGQAWGDFDQDGWVDLYLTDQRGPNSLYRNAGDGTFTLSPLSKDVSLRESASGGAIFADYDNDGWPDLYVLNYGADVLFHNDGGKGFTDVTYESGIRDGGSGMTASWADYDGDGYLDLYVANYGCHPCDSPRRDQGDQDRLYHNNGDGTFTDVTNALPAEVTRGWGFVAGWLDYDSDGDLDLYLVNDVRGTRYLPPNALLRNDGPGCRNWCFADVSAASGAGVRADGMGLAVADYDGDGNLDLYVTNTGWAHMPLTGPAILLRNKGDGTFEDVSRKAGVDVDAISWGAVFLDSDNDGWQDLYVALGVDPEDIGLHATLNRLLRNRGDATFEDLSTRSGASFPDNTFGVATADYNNDGWPDLVIGNIDEGYHLYANTGALGPGNHRLTVRLRGGLSVNRDAVGARVYLITSDGRTQLREVMSGSSLGAGNDLALTFGLGNASVRSLRVVWPNGHEQTFGNVPSDVLWQLSYEGKLSISPLADPVLPHNQLAPVRAPQGIRPGGYIVPAIAILATLGLAGWMLMLRLGFSSMANRLLGALVVGVLVFQLGHFLEHLSQLSFWFAHPGADPWITPWGRISTDGFAGLAGHHGSRATGTELLHLTGNWITFVGIVVLYIALRRHVAARQMRATTAAFWLQLVHVTEHVSLTSSWFLLGTPIGLSTLFGQSFQLEGAWAPSIRIWWHFVMVLAPTIAFVLALHEFRALRLAAPEPTATRGKMAGLFRRSILTTAEDA